MSKDRLEKLLIELTEAKTTNYERIALFKQTLSYTDSDSKKFELKKQIEASEKEIQDINIKIDSVRREISNIDSRLQPPQITRNLIQFREITDILINFQNKTDEQQSDTTNEINRGKNENIKPIRETITNEPIKGNYNDLRKSLANLQWKEADLATTQILIQVAKRQKYGWLTFENIANFSCSDILMIDQLWQDASGGQFGLSVQRNIWLSVDGKPGKFERVIFNDFGDKVGWRINKKWISTYNNFKFCLDAPNGHLPSFIFPAANDQFVTWHESFKHFLPRIETCFSGDI